MLLIATNLQFVCGMQQAYTQNMDLSKAWLKDPRKAVATLQGLSIEVRAASPELLLPPSQSTANWSIRLAESRVWCRALFATAFLVRG